MAVAVVTLQSLTLRVAGHKAPFAPARSGANPADEIGVIPGKINGLFPMPV
jgi:hypothetical protein